MDRLSTTLITMVSRRPRGQSSDTVVRRRDPVQEHQSTLRAWTWVGRTVRAAAGPGRYWFGCWCGREGDRERYALMRGVLRIARQRGLAKRQVGSVDDVITAWRVQ
jgi:hypothetical protein